MKFCAIICEFNPFHSGHAHIISEAKRITGLPVLCLMSGNFCQRAEATVLEKHTRAQDAISAGADVVFEMPFVFVTGSATDFATGAVHTLASLPVSHLVFGAECADITSLQKIADIETSFSNSPTFKAKMRVGKSYQTTMAECVAEAAPELFQLLEGSNNILAVEYLKALKGTNIVPVVVERKGNHLSNKESDGFASSSAIRESAKNGTVKNFAKFLTDITIEALKSPKNSATIDEHLFFALQTATIEKLACLQSSNGQIASRICRIIQTSKNMTDFLDNCVTRQISRTRLRRIALENFFGTTKEFMKKAKAEKPITTLLAKRDDLHFDAFFDKEIDLILKKSDFKKFETNPLLAQNILADKLYQR